MDMQNVRWSLRACREREREGTSETVEFSGSEVVKEGV